MTAQIPAPATDHTDHVGSLVRPERLIAAQQARDRGELSEQVLTGIEDQCILQAIELQRETGIGVLTDGEFRRRSWMAGLARGAEGVTIEAPAERVRSVLGITGKVRPRGRLCEQEARFLKEHAGSRFKITIPCAAYYMLRAWWPGVTDQVYESRRALGEDLVPIIHDEVRALLAEGVPYVQLDAPHYAMFVDEQTRARLRADGFDPDEGLDTCIELDAAILNGLDRRQAHIGMHVCRANPPGGSRSSGSYEVVAEKVFNSLDVDTWLLEYDSPRAGGFEPLRFMPAHKKVVLGLVTTKQPTLEDPETLLRQIDQAAQYVPLERLALSPQCGFASGGAGYPLSIDDQRHKLELVVATARKVWGAA
ncbi:MAG: cobalamin-independent methionine synthase II family protein [Chloroflexi bacterium]|nr:cobalamin-independent methionine synthase II family protein [Chloroflexota bacterium]